MEMLVDKYDNVRFLTASKKQC